MKELVKNGMTAGNANDAVMKDLIKVGKSMVTEWRKTASPEAIKILDAFHAATM